MNARKPMNLLLTLIGVAWLYLALHNINDADLCGVLILIGLGFLVQPVVDYCKGFRHSNFLNFRREVE